MPIWRIKHEQFKIQVQVTLTATTESASDLPVVDDIAVLQFAYFLDPNPSRVPAPTTGQSSCLFEAGSPPLPLLRALGRGSFTPVSGRELADGPLCGSSDERFDGDVLRIRLVRVTIGASPPGAGGAPESVQFDVAPRNQSVRP